MRKAKRRTERKTVEKREDALARLLHAACHLLPDDLSELGDKEAKRADKVVSEALWWLELYPRGLKPVATLPSRRMGSELVRSWSKHKLVGRQLVSPTLRCVSAPAPRLKLMRGGKCK